MRLTNNERNLLKNAVSYHWELYEQHSGTFYWNNDPEFSFNLTKTFHACLEKGLLENITMFIGLRVYRATPLAFSFKCPENLCYHGQELTIFEDDGNAEMTGHKCSTCNGKGLIPEIEN